MSFFLMAAKRAGTGAGGGGGVLFTDDFSTGDLSKTNAYFTWGANTNCTVISGFSRTGYTGNCVRFNFDNIAEQLAELRFFFGPSADSSGATCLHHSEVWLRYYIYFPTGAESPTVGPEAENADADNNKFMRCYALPESDYPRYGASFYDGSGAGETKVGAQAGNYPGTGTIGQAPTSAAEFTGSIVSDALRGTWVKIEFHFRAGTLGDGGPDSGNGVHEMWVDDALQWSIANVNDYEATPTGAARGFDGGYLFGAQDAAWLNDGTYVYLDDFAYSTTGRV
jgi:hypothetical protein